MGISTDVSFINQIQILFQELFPRTKRNAISFSILLGILCVSTNCKLPELNATCDPNSKNFFLSSLVTNSQICFNLNSGNSDPLNTLYLVDRANGLIYFYNTRNDGVLTPIGSIPTPSANPAPMFALWNGKHLVTNGVNSFRSFLRNPDGSLTFKNDYTSTNIPVFMQGSSAFHSSGKFFYYTTSPSVASFSKLQIDESGTFFGEVNTTEPNRFWYVLSPIHPTQNYFMTFHKDSLGITRIFYPISDLNTGTLGVSTNSNTITQGDLYPENGNCVYSLNANFMYCANITNQTNAGRIVQFAVTPTTNTLIGTSILVQSVDSFQSPKSVVLHPSGNYIYAYGNTNIYAYSVDQTTGIINPAPISVTPTPGGTSCPTNVNISRMAIHPKGNMLYAVCVANTATNQLGSYPIRSNGQLSSPSLLPIPNNTNSMTLLFVEGK